MRGIRLENTDQSRRNFIKQNLKDSNEKSEGSTGRFFKYIDWKELDKYEL